MAWRTTKVEDQRKQFINAYLEKRYTMASLCRQFEISRPIGYKWVYRYREKGLEGLTNRSKAPLTQAKETDPKLVEQILKVKFERSDWGPKKVRGHLVKEFPLASWPSKTTIGNIFDRHGLTIPRKYRKRLPVRTKPLAHCQQMNDVWSVDFKGWFLTKDGHKCEPFTLTDSHSRYLIRCLRLFANDTDHVWAVLDAAFREYGLPLYMRSDNGPPFATCNAGRLSPLSVRLIKAGVIPEWIEPGNPQQNGRHERMHLTLKNEATFPRILNLDEQQMKLTEFQHYYNFVRPHEALGQITPGSIYQPSQRSWSGKLKAPEYPESYKVARVKSCGKMSWKGSEIYVSRTLAGEPVGIEKNEEEGGFTVYFGAIILGILTPSGEFTICRRGTRRKYDRMKGTAVPLILPLQDSLEEREGGYGLCFSKHNFQKSLAGPPLGETPQPPLLF
jgi:transposase InsO family protein/transposase-like protein